jgi:molybdopterin synthase sulfur carrier subunit
MINVNFFGTLRIFLKTKQVRISIDELSVFELLQQCEAKVAKPLLSKLVDEEGNIRPGTMILANGQNVLHLQGLHTIVRNGADIAIFPPGGGG